MFYYVGYIALSSLIAYFVVLSLLVAHIVQRERRVLAAGLAYENERLAAARERQQRG